MRDPHVKALHYKVVHSENIDYDSAPALEHETDAFYVRIEDGKAVFEMVEHHATEESAKAAVEEFIRAWEIQAGLQYGPDEFHLRFESPEIIDRNPEPGSVVLQVHSTNHIVVSDNVKLHVGRGKYPDPPEQFLASPDVEVMFARYRGYRRGRESLSSMAYFCLTVMEMSFNKPVRKMAARHYAVQYDILRKLGKLTANRGGAAEGRKAPYGDPYTPQEKAWIEKAVKLLIRRVGEREADPTGNLPVITIADVSP